LADPRLAGGLVADRRYPSAVTLPPVRRTVPRAISLLPDAVPAAVAAVTVVLVLLLDLHSFSSALVFPLAAVAAVGAVVAVARVHAGSTTLPGGVRWDVGALLLAVGFAVINARYASQHLLVDRDPAVYATTAEYLAHHSSLPVTIDTHAFAGGVNYDTSGYGLLPKVGQLFPQGMHATPALLAVLGRLLGPSMLLRGDAVIGGVAVLAVYAFARRVVGGGWGLLAAAVLAVSMPEIHFTRDVYSEPLGQLLLFGGLALLWHAYERGSPAAYALGGFVFGAGMTTRTDAFLALVGPLALIVILLGGAPPGRRAAERGRVLALSVGVLVPTVIGLRDLQTLAPGYYHDLGSELAVVRNVLVAAVITSVAAVLLAWYAGPPRRLLAARLPTLAWTVTGLFLLVFVGLALRPLFGVHRSGTQDGRDLVTFLQKGLGYAVDPRRDYAELSLAWPGYYLGPVTVGLGVLGLALLTARLIRNRQLTIVPFLAVWLPTSLGYLVRPSILPDQIWAVRRLLPITIPGLILACVVVLAALAAGPGRRLAARPRRVWLRPVARVSAVLLAVQAVVVALVVTAPLATAREYVPELAAVQRVCGVFGRHAAVLGIDELDQAMNPSLTSNCRVPVASLAAPSRAVLARQQAAAAADGRALWVYAKSPEALMPLADGPAAHPVPTVSLVSQAWEQLLLKAPAKAPMLIADFYLARVRPDGSVVIQPPGPRGG